MGLRQLLPWVSVEQKTANRENSAAMFCRLRLNRSRSVTTTEMRLFELQAFVSVGDVDEETYPSKGVSCLFVVSCIPNASGVQNAASTTEAETCVVFKMLLWCLHL